MTTLKPDPEPPTHVPDDASLLAWAEFVSMRVRPVRRSLWLSWIDADHRLLPVLVPVDDIPDTPDAKLLDNLGFVVKSVIDKEAAGGSAVFMLERPGGDAVCDSDRRWNAGVRRAALDHGVTLRGGFLATAGGVRPLTLDDM